MTQEQGRSYLVWDKGSRPLFVVKSMTRRQWLVFVTCTSVVVVGIAVVLGGLFGIGAGIIPLFVLLVVMPMAWYFGRQGALKAPEKRP
jgi:glucose-6-phosphate-specific signal transduction histidine kinase